MQNSLPSLSPFFFIIGAAADAETRPTTSTSERQRGSVSLTTELRGVG